MSAKGHNQEFLDEILAEGRQAGAREMLFDDTLRLVRGRRRVRRIRRAALTMAILAAVGWLFWRPAPTKPVLAELPKPYRLVRTQPLAQTSLVATEPFAAASIVSSAPNAVLVATVPSQHLAREIDDDDLLALAGPRPAVLIRLGPDSADLVFTPPPAQDNP